MKTINMIKNVAIILDFAVSIIAASIQKVNTTLSESLFGLSAIILLIAVICVFLELIKTFKK